MVDGWVVTAATVTRWRRYGKDRLYVTALDGTALGWQDLLTGECTLQAPEREGELRAALAAHGGVVVTADPEPVRGVNEAVVLPVCAASDPSAVCAAEDLAQRSAGTAAREQAVALRRAAPVRTVVARLLGVHTDERAWRIGADGEVKVAAQLEKLVLKDPRWRVLHAVPVGERGSDIDHVVLGPGGVYTLNAKHHPGATLWVAGNTFLVNGKRRPHLRNSEHEAQRATRLLSAACAFEVEVTGVVVPVGADDLVIRAAPRHVHVVPRRQLRAWLLDRPEAQGAKELDQIWAAARRSRTWRPA